MNNNIDYTNPSVENTANEHSQSLKDTLANIMIKTVPSYANKFIYSLGFLSMISFFMIIASGFVLIFNGPFWWLHNSTGIFFRSIHLWSTQFFIIFIILHLIIVFLSSGFKYPRRLTWVVGSLMMFFVLFEAELGYGLRGDFSSQWRVLQASDLYNGSGLGIFVNNLNYAQIYGIHIALIPIILIALLGFHYLLVRTKGIAKPYKKDTKYKMVKANHTKLFIRGIGLIVVIVIFAIIFPSPFIAQTKISDIASQDPSNIATTIFSEYMGTSGTATYFDSINPYTYNLKDIYVINPYLSYIKIHNEANYYQIFLSLPSSIQSQDLANANKYFSGSSYNPNVLSENPMVNVVNTLVLMASNHLYSAYLASENGQGNNTYVGRFLSDTGVLDAEAQSLGITTQQLGMVHEEKGIIPPGAWWLAPIGVMDNTILANDPNQDRDGAIILASLVIILISYPYIPYLNRLPEYLRLDNIIWKEKEAY